MMDNILITFQNLHPFKYYFIVVLWFKENLDELEKAVKLTNAKFLVLSSHNYHIAINFATQYEVSLFRS